MTALTALTSIVITGVLTVIFGIWVYMLFPDSPLHANFLTYEERAQAILRIKENHSGIEQKTFKRYQSASPSYFCIILLNGRQIYRSAQRP